LALHEAAKGIATRKADPQVSAHTVAAEFVESVRDLPQVVRVAAEPRGRGWRLWTLISAPAFDNAHRESVYEAELSFLDRAGGTFEFRVVNLEELTERALEVVPPNAVTVFEREQQAPRA
jgi:hypothetical protein